MITNKSGCRLSAVVIATKENSSVSIDHFHKSIIQEQKSIAKVLKLFNKE